MRSLFQIGEGLRELADLLTETDGEIPDGEVGAALESFFDQLIEDREEKLNSYGWLIREIESRAEARRNEVNRLGALMDADYNAVKRLKERLKYFMDGQAVTKIETDHFKFAIQKNGGALPLVYPDAWDYDPAEAPEAFQKRVIQLDKEAIREAIRNDEETHGATLAERASHLRIR